MKRLEVTQTFFIDEIGQVSAGPISFLYRGCDDATLFKASVPAEERVVTTDVVKPTMQLSTARTAELILELTKIGFDQDEAEAWIAKLSAKRIIDVCHWIRHKNGVGSPKALATKLFAMG